MKTFARSSSASRGGPRLAGDRVGEAAADGVHDRGREHEPQQVRVQRDQDLFRQVVDDVAIDAPNVSTNARRSGVACIER
jgi:hypothetical protein